MSGSYKPFDVWRNKYMCLQRRLSRNKLRKTLYHLNLLFLFFLLSFLQECYVSVHFGGICEINENCIDTPGAICNTGRCQCPETLKLVDGLCSLGNKICINVMLQCIYLIGLKIIYSRAV